MEVGFPFSFTPCSSSSVCKNFSQLCFFQTPLCWICVALGKIFSISFPESLKLYSTLSFHSLHSNLRNKRNIIVLIKRTRRYKKELKTCILKETVNDSLERFYSLIKISDLVHRRKTIFFLPLQAPQGVLALISERGGICKRDSGMLKVYKPSCLSRNKCSPTAEATSHLAYGKPYK